MPSVTLDSPPPLLEGVAAVDAYLAAQPEPARSRLRALREIVRAEAPASSERMAYGIPTWHLRENLLHLGGFAQHVGVYPGPAAIEAFAEQLVGFRTSKGAIQLPHDAPLPLELVRSLVRWRLAAVEKLPERRKRRSAARS
jgi:uncharacterized protein YdhG (YjbR/CyaY superfamily)